MASEDDDRFTLPSCHKPTKQGTLLSLLLSIQADQTGNIAVTSSVNTSRPNRKIPLDALRISARKRMSLYLNTQRLLNEKGIVPDFNGLAEQIGFDYLEIQNFARLRDPTMEVLKEWSGRPDLNPTVDNLLEYLYNMGREDVVTDCKPNIMLDIEHYVKNRERCQNRYVPLQDDTVTQSFMEDHTDHNVDEYRYMTIDDVANDSPTFYDAFVCYDPEGYDLQFVKKMLSELESPKYNLKLFVPFRDDLPGSSTHTVSAKLIQERCRRMVIIMSPRFLTSPACDFQTKFAHCLSPGSRSKKLVPVLLVPCEIPQILRHVTLCDFTKRDLMEWFWVRLARAIKAPLVFSELQISTRVKAEDINITNDLDEYKRCRERSGSSSSSSQPLPIIHDPSGPRHASGGSPAASSPMELSESPKPALSSKSSKQAVSTSPGTSGTRGQTPSPIPPRRTKRQTDRSIPQLFPSSQC